MNRNISYNFVPIRITKNTMTIKIKEASTPHIICCMEVDLWLFSENTTLDLMTGISTLTRQDGTIIQNMVHKKYLNDQRKAFGIIKVIPELSSLKKTIYIKWD